jgi:hypothetical protein
LRIKKKDHEILAFKTEALAKKKAKDERGKRVEIILYQNYLGALNAMRRMKMAQKEIVSLEGQQMMLEEQIIMI